MKKNRKRKWKGGITFVHILRAIYLYILFFSYLSFFLKFLEGKQIITQSWKLYAF